MEEELQSALQGLTKVVEQATREADRRAAHQRAETERWRQECERERERVRQLEEELASCQAKLATALEPTAGADSAGARPPLQLRPSLRRRPPLSRRHTMHLGGQILSAPSSPGAQPVAFASLLRLSVGQAQQAGQQEQEQQQQQHPPPLQRQASWERGGRGTMTLSRLGRMLGACLLLESAAATTGAGSEAEGCPADGSHQEDGGGGSVKTGAECALLLEAQGSQVSLMDDGGGAGVGATAAAAVSVALARSWAAAAGAGPGHRQDMARLQAARLGGAGGGGDGGHGKGEGPGARPAARFKLMAAVPRSQARRSKLQTSESMVSLAGEGASSGETPPSIRPGSFLIPSESGMALDSLMPASPRGGLDDSQEAAWRALGSHLKLQWLSPPSTVLVVCKPVPSVLGACVRALCWLLRRGLWVYVEPAVHAELLRAVAEELGAEELRTGGDGGNNGRRGSGGNGSFGGGMPAAAGAGAGAGAELSLAGSGSLGSSGGGGYGTVRPPRHPPPPSSSSSSSQPSSPAFGGRRLLLCDVDLQRQLLSWDPCSCCENTLPTSVAEALDLVITLGGDGTVLWTCAMFANGAVPPIVPFAMGSLGFMTPFPIERMEAVLSRTTTPEHGFPIMLRHRLQCRILRGDDGGGAAAAVANDGSVDGSYSWHDGGGVLVGGAAAHCGEDVVVLNEVVIDRGATACLTNLQVYVDHNFVTVIQGDGLIVATPTGSTAYSLAAGGAMVHPGVPALLFTPICPHTISSRPLVFPEHVVLRVKVPLESRSEAYCSFDGRARQPLRPGDSVLIRMSPWPVPMVCSLDASHDWFLSVRDGLNWNMRKLQASKGS